MRLKRLLGSLIILGLVMGCGLEAHALAPVSEDARRNGSAHARQDVAGWGDPQVYLPLIINPTIPSPTPVPTPTPGPLGCYVTHNGAFEEQLYELINNIRDDYGLDPLVVNYNLENAAGAHNDEMAENGYLNHTGLDGRTYWERAVDAGYTGRWGGEIILYGRSTPAGAIDWWMNSTAHRAMILSDSDDFGAGYAYCLNHYYTVDFGHR